MCIRDSDNGMMMTVAGDATTGSNTYAMADSVWTHGGTAGDSPYYHNSTAAGVRTSNLNVSSTNIGGTGGGVNVVITDASDGTGGDSITMTMLNWYGASDRSAPHGQGSSVKGAGMAACTTPAPENILRCSLNHPDDGIAVELPTEATFYPNDGGNTLSYGITAHKDTATFFYGLDYATPHNVSVYINGVQEAIGNTKAVSVLDDVVLKCSDSACTNSDIQIGIPSAWNMDGISNKVSQHGSATATDENWNVTARLSIYDGKTVKLTFGLAAEHQANATATTNGAGMGAFFDPSISFLNDEPGVRIGQIEDGGASWCDAWWFLAKCGDALSYDGVAADGMDGVILHLSLIHI